MNWPCLRILNAFGDVYQNFALKGNLINWQNLSKLAETDAEPSFLLHSYLSLTLK